MTAQLDSALDALKSRIVSAQLGPDVEERGTVLAVADGLARVSGLPGAGLNELVEFSRGARGFVLTLEEDAVQIAFLDPSDKVAAGDDVKRIGRAVSVPVGDAMLSRVLDPLGRPLDGEAPPAATDHLPAERLAPSIIERDFVSDPMETGLLVIDALFAVGRGQRELIIGERQTGKTSIAVDTILNQKSSDVICIYVAIGLRMSAVQRVMETVRASGPIERTIFIVAEAAAAPGLRWLAPFSATSIAEWHRAQGRHVLIVYDDLTKHAATHRELALLARQPPGREAFPGDIFYLHARLLERAGKLSAARGGGSLTALPIAEIDAGNLSAYIPTNLISIADGQIVTSAALFAANQRPAVDVGLSVSRVGGKAQSRAMKAAAGSLRLDYAQYLEMKMFARFGGFGADPATANRLRHGERIAALLAQGRQSPLPAVAQISLLAALNAGIFDDVAVADFPALKEQLPDMIAADPLLSARIGPQTELDDSLRTPLLDIVRAALERL